MTVVDRSCTLTLSSSCSRLRRITASSIGIVPWMRRRLRAAGTAPVAVAGSSSTYCSPTADRSSTLAVSPVRRDLLAVVDLEVDGHDTGVAGLIVTAPTVPTTTPRSVDVGVGEDATGRRQVQVDGERLVERVDADVARHRRRSPPIR